MQRYESYKASGIPWVGEIPSHWGIKKNKFLLSERKAIVGKDAPKFKLLSLTLQGVILRDMENPKGKFPAEFDTYKQVSPDDLIFCLFDVEETPRTVGLAKHHGMITGAYTVTRCNEQVSSAFLYYYYLSLDEGKRLRSLYTGLRNVITRDTFFSLATPFPPREEQDRIVAFLDQKTAEIDAAIAKKERLIELLGEQKEGLISRAVLLGLRQQVELRKSSIKWLKNIPNGWEELPCRYLFREVTRRDRDGSEQKLSVTQRNGLVPTDQMAEHSTQAQSFDEFKLCHVGDLVLNKYKAHLGVFWAAKVRGIITNNYTVFRPTKKAFPPYFELLFHTKWMCDQFASVVYGIVDGMMPLYTKDFYSVQTLCPPLHEQQEIVSYCDEVTKKIDSAIAQEERAIQLLRELKTALVTSYVTGKAKV